MPFPYRVSKSMITRVILRSSATKNLLYLISFCLPLF
jgi:hypothetical protein